IPDRLSDLVQKGEITRRYYNPGDYFDEVHILMTNDDTVSVEAVQTMTGRAKIRLHNLPQPGRLFYTTLGYRPSLLHHWAGTGVALAREIKPDLIRCHGNSLNGFVASRIKRALRVPLVVSLHTHPFNNIKVQNIQWWPGWRRRLFITLGRGLEKATLRASDVVMPVYESIRDYAVWGGAKRIEVVYNVLNSKNLVRKESFELNNPARIVCVGRQLVGKNPENIIRAVAELEDGHLTLVGDGPLHEYLREVTVSCGVSEKVTFIKAIPNDELCQMLSRFDIFAAHSDYNGIPKAVMEPMLCGLPIVINRAPCVPIHELTGNCVTLVENTKDGYLNGFKKLVENNHTRVTMGQAAYEYAWATWDPDRMEARVVEIYEGLVRGKK
ncbi:MAG: glycosyltransferase, partial [bacterium]